MPSINIAEVPPMTWYKEPLAWTVEDTRFTITAGSRTDLFTNPADGKAQDNAPAALFTPPDGDFMFSANAKVTFASTFDAGTLHIRLDENHWAKLCLEFSPQRQPMIVSVVTRTISDDCNSATINNDSAYLRLLRQGNVFAFHYSLDSQHWNFVRFFSLGPDVDPKRIQVGLSAQSPMGESCTVLFTDIHCTTGTVADLRSGE
jgi:uncharacterized protein